MYYKKNKEGELEGMISTHVDDFNLAGREEFPEAVIEEIKKVLDVSKVEDGRFRFKGIYVEGF